jgi:hypothetical protein
MTLETSRLQDAQDLTASQLESSPESQLSTRPVTGRRQSSRTMRGRHLHMRDVRVAHHKIRVARERKERESKEHLRPMT